MSIFDFEVNTVANLIKERDALNAKRSAWFREEGPGVCLDKEYRLLCKEMNKLTAKINALSTVVKVAA